MVARFIASSCSLTRPFRLALVLITLLLTLPQMAWGVTEEVTKTITFNKAVSTVSSNINNSTMSVSVNEQVGGASTTYDGEVNIWDSDGLLTEYSCSDGGGAVFTLKSTAIYGQIFTIEIPGNYPAIPTQVTLKVGWEHAKSSGASGEIVAKIQVGDYDTGSLVGNTDPVIEDYANNHPFLSTQTSKQHFGSDALVYTANNRNGLGTNRETRKSLFIYVSLNGNDVQQYPTTFTIKEATITYNREAYGPVVAGVHVGDDNTSNVLSDDYSSVSYDEGSNTLTLKGVHLNSSNNGISVPSDMNINLVGYSDVGTINVTSGTLNFTTSTTLPGCLKTNVAGNSTITYGAGTGLSWNGTMVKSSITNPTECYVTGYKADGDNYTISGADGDCEIYSESSAVIHLHASNATVDQNNRYIKVSPATSTPNEAYLCPSDLTSMYPLTKIYLQYEWGTCANHNVSVKAMGFTSTGDYAHNSVSYSDPVDLGDGGIVEIPLTSAVTDGLVGLVFTSSSDFSLIPINVGFLKYTTTNYGITVAGTEVTSENATTGITAGDGKVYYNATNNILTLNGATINGVIESTIGDLTIHLTGNSIIKATGNETSLISSTNNGTLTFETDANPIGSLELLSSTGGPFANTPWSGFTNVVYNSDLDYSSTEKKVGLISYSIVVGVGGDQNGTEVTSANKNDVLTDGTVSFDSENNTLTLNGAEITKAIEYSGSTLLTIALKGTNRINNDTGTYGICSTGGSLNIVKATDATSAELTISFYGGTNVPISASYTLGSGLYLKPVTNSKSIITEDPEFVTVDGYLIPDGGSVSDGDAGTITYSASDKTLTITSFNKTFYTDAIQTGISGLKVKLVGASTITCDSYYAFSAFATGASIQFIKDDATSKLTMTGTAFNNFGSSSITYDGLFYYSDNTNKVITQAAAPALSRERQDNGHGIYYTYALIDYAASDKSGGSVLYSAANPLLKYSFDYADPQKQDVSDQVFPEAGIKMTDPGILTTWVEVGSYKGPESKGVRYGFLENPIEMEFDGTKQISITPAPTMTNPVTYSVHADYTEDFDDFAVLDNQNNKITINSCYDGVIGFTFVNNDGGYTSLNLDSTNVSFEVIPSKPTLSLESGAYYIGQQITATPTVPDGGYNTYFKINDTSPGSYTYTFNSAGIFNVSSVSYYIRGGGLSPIFGKYATATIVINNEPTFTASVGVNAYNETNPQTGDVEVQLAVTDLQNNCTLMYYLDSDAGNPQPYQSSISLSETTTINAFIRYTDNTVTPNIVYDSAPVSKTYTVKQEVVDPFGNDLSYRTCYLSDYSLNKPDGIKVYIITGVSGNSVTTTAIDYIPQGVAVLLEKDGNAPAGGYVAETYTGAAGNFSGNMLKYANAEVTVTDDLYILYNNEFVKATGVIPIENCYLDLSSVNPSRGMYDIGDGATAIKGITLSEGEEAWYDLQGRRIERPTKPGLYIRNGKKVVVNNK